MEVNRYLINFDTENVKKTTTDVLIVGCGLSALYSALIIAETKKVILVTSGEKLHPTYDKDIDSNITNNVINLIHQISPKDTIVDGRGLTTESSIAKYVENVDFNRERLCKYCDVVEVEIPADQIPAERLDSVINIQKTEDFIEAKLADKVRANKNIEVVDEYLACDLLTRIAGTEVECYGMVSKNFTTGDIKVFEFKAIMLAQDGYKGVFDNHYHDSYGDDIAMFLRAGGETVDMEFVHFWPMAVNAGDGKELIVVPNMILPDGAMLRNMNGERFMPKYSELAEFAPSSTVGRAIEMENKRLKSENAYIDITFKDLSYIRDKHKSLYELCLAKNINIANEYIPVRTKAGFCIGGIKADEYGKTSIKNVYAVNSDACNGFFGARLTRRNIVSYKVVFPGISADSIVSNWNDEKVEFTDVKCSVQNEMPCSAVDVEHLLARVRHNNEKNVGIVRDSAGLYEALKTVRSIKAHTEHCDVNSEKSAILQNILLISEIMIMSAIERRESRGSHFRSDYPDVDNVRWRRHIIRKVY